MKFLLLTVGEIKKSTILVYHQEWLFFLHIFLKTENTLDVWPDDFLFTRYTHEDSARTQKRTQFDFALASCASRMKNSEIFKTTPTLIVIILWLIIIKKSPSPNAFLVSMSRRHCKQSASHGWGKGSLKIHQILLPLVLKTQTHCLWMSIIFGLVSPTIVSLTLQSNCKPWNSFSESFLYTAHMLEQ